MEVNSKYIISKFIILIELYLSLDLEKLPKILNGKLYLLNNFPLK